MKVHKKEMPNLIDEIRTFNNTKWALVCVFVRFWYERVLNNRSMQNNKIHTINFCFALYFL